MRRPLRPLCISLLAALGTACEAPLDEAMPLAHSHDTSATTASAAIRGVDLLVPIGQKALVSRALPAGEWSTLALDYEGELRDLQWSVEGGDQEDAGQPDQLLVRPADAARLRVLVTATDLVGAPLSAAFELPVEPTEAESAIVNPAATGLVATSTDSLSTCRVVLDAADTPHLIYRNDTHAQLWYATYTGGQWVSEFVDGPGFAVGGAVQNRLDLTIDPSGILHAGYFYAGGAVRYARRQGGVWSLESASTGASTSAAIAVAVDPANSNRPNILFTDPLGGGQDQPVISYRTAANTWTSSTWASASYDDHAMGAFGFTTTGTAWVGYGYYYDSQVVSWTPAAGWGSTEYVAATDTYGEPRSLSMVNNQPMILDGDSLGIRTAANTWSVYEWEAADIYDFDLAAYNNLPRIAVDHGGLELIHVDSDGYFVYDLVDESDVFDLSVVVDSTGVTHACYEVDNEIYFW